MMQTISGSGDPFSGDAEAIAIREAIILAAGAKNNTDNEKIYQFLGQPKTSIAYELAEALRKLGYSIRKAEVKV